jgi:hypothetical protein
LPDDEPFPASNWPPALTSVLTGRQTAQYRPDSPSGRKLDLGLVSEADHAYWTNAPQPLEYPLVINGSGAGGCHDTWLYGGEIQGTDNPDIPRDRHYAHTSGIEHSCDRPTGYAVADGVVVKRMGDGFRFVDEGTAYLKRFWGADLNDGFIELDAWTGDAFIYDCLVEGCYSGISDIGSGSNRGKTLTVDGLLLWIKPTVDTPSSRGGEWAGDGGFAELDVAWSDGRYRGSNGIWEGDPGSFGTVVVRNSWFRIDRPSVWNNLGWPGQAAATWNPQANLTVGPNVRVLWTGMSRSGVTTSQGYPGPALPAGVELVSGQGALTMWNLATAAWKTAHGY